MNNTEFVFWLQGHFELDEQEAVLSSNQIENINNHLKLVKDGGSGYLGNFIPKVETLLEIFGNIREQFKDHDCALRKILTDMLRKKTQEELTKKTPTMDRPTPPLQIERRILPPDVTYGQTQSLTPNLKLVCARLNEKSLQVGPFKFEGDLPLEQGTIKDFPPASC